MAIRVTNNMILTNSARNINNTKITLDKTNTQMTTQQKISRPSEDPVIAVRSLRLQTTAAKTDQYYEKNIPDARSWLEVTETALTNIKDVITDIRTLCVRGATDTLTQSDRNTILSQIRAYQDSIYKEGNADYAGRTVFTGFRTDKNLTFIEDEHETVYQIKQTMSASDMTSYRYFANTVEAPSTPAEVMALDDQMRKDMSTAESYFYHLRSGYNDLADVGVMDFGARGTVDLTGATSGTAVAVAGGDGSLSNVYVFENEAEWEVWSEGQTSSDGKKVIGDNDLVIIKQTGDFIFGDQVAHDMISSGDTFELNYTKSGFKNGELRPEYYYDCTDISDPANPVEFKKFDDEGNPLTYDIKYTIAQNLPLTVNTEASLVFDNELIQDMSDMISAMSMAIEAHNKLGQIDKMMADPNYASDAMQEKLKQWRDLAQKEADYADDNLEKLYTSELDKCDGYLSKMNLSITRIGCTMDQLTMTEKRMSENQESLENLRSQNDDVDLSQVVIDYTAIYTAYQSSLTAAGRLYQQTLLNYI